MLKKLFQLNTRILRPEFTATCDPLSTGWEALLCNMSLLRTQYLSICMFKMSCAMFLFMVFSSWASEPQVVVGRRDLTAAWLWSSLAWADAQYFFASFDDGCLEQHQAQFAQNTLYLWEHRARGSRARVSSSALRHLQTLKAFYWSYAMRRICLSTWRLAKTRTMLFVRTVEVCFLGHGAIH